MHTSIHIYIYTLGRVEILDRLARLFIRFILICKHSVQISGLWDHHYPPHMILTFLHVNMHGKLAEIIKNPKIDKILRFSTFKAQNHIQQHFYHQSAPFLKNFLSRGPDGQGRY